MKIKCVNKLIWIILIAGTLFFTSCSSLGYGVVLWNDSEHNIPEGSIVKVFIKSNISQVYVIGVPNSKEKIEIPLWQITEPSKKSHAKKYAQKFSEFEHTYASVKLDGLPIRAEPVNTAKQVYRLRKGEIIRVLFKGKGQAVTNGRGNLKGEWLRVLTSTGTLGWCFSFNLDLFDRTEKTVSENIENEETEVQIDEYLESIKAKSWYPEYYSSLIKHGRIDLKRINAEYGFKFVIDENMSTSVHMRLSDVNKTWSYSEIKKVNDYQYEFDDLKLTLTCRNGSFMTIQYMDSDGKMKSENFVALEENIQELIDSEILRRQEELKALAEFGPIFVSSNYGTITFNNENNITWKNYNLLVPSVISKSALGSANVTIDYFITNALKTEFDGVLTFHFTGMSEEVNFLYKKVDGGLRLEDATKATIKENVVSSRSTSPLVMFFQKK